MLFRSMKNVASLPATVQTLSETVNGISDSVKAAQAMAHNAAQAAETEKKDVVARLIANGSCPLDEAVLNGMALDILKKLELSYQPTNYAALGGFAPVVNVSGDEAPLGIPSYFSAEG